MVQTGRDHHHADIAIIGAVMGTQVVVIVVIWTFHDAFLSRTASESERRTKRRKVGGPLIALVS